MSLVHPAARWCLALLLIGQAALAPGRADAQLGGPPVEAYGYTFLKIGSPGNRPATPQEAPRLAAFGITAGRVDQEFRISKLEVTTTQWLEFMKAYTPYYTGTRLSTAFTGRWILPGDLTGPDPKWTITPGAENWAADMSWRYAARYVNWLNNDKRPEQWAFENGAYDTSTFTRNPDGSLNDQIAHNPDAKFWIPTYDEWLKANFYDPSRYGPGQEGYWYNAGSRQTPLKPGFPPGGETIAGMPELGIFRDADVGLFPDVQSPWGVLDTSGGMKEWTESIYYLPQRWRFYQGSRTGQSIADDRVDQWFAGGPLDAIAGLRIASSIPAPGATGMLLVTMGVFSYRRYRR